MKMTLREAIAHYAELSEVANKALPVKISYAIGKNLKKLQGEVELYEKMRIERCEIAAEKDEDGKALKADKIVNGKKQSQYIVSDEENQKLQKELDDLLNTEIEVDIMTFREEEYDKVDKAERYDVLTGSDFAALEFMTKE